MRECREPDGLPNDSQPDIYGKSHAMAHARVIRATPEHLGQCGGYSEGEGKRGEGRVEVGGGNSPLTATPPSPPAHPPQGRRNRDERYKTQKDPKTCHQPPRSFCQR